MAFVFIIAFIESCVTDMAFEDSIAFMFDIVFPITEAVFCDADMALEFIICWGTDCVLESSPRGTMILFPALGCAPSKGAYADTFSPS